MDVLGSETREPKDTVGSRLRIRRDVVEGYSEGLVDGTDMNVLGNVRGRLERVKRRLKPNILRR